MLSLSDAEWKPLVDKAWANTLKQMRSTEIYYTRLLANLTEDAENCLLQLFVSAGPSVMRNGPRDVSLRVMLVIVEELSKIYFL